jgi:DNA-binding MarR family transcriptional regulator
MVANREELQGQILELTSEFDRLVAQHAYSDFWSHCDLTVQQMKLLLIVDRLGSPSMGEAAAAIGSSLSSTTRLVDRLVMEDLVGRSERPGDRRHVFLHLTDRGHELLNRLYSDRVAFSHEIVSRLETADLEHVAHAVRASLRVFRAILAEPKAEAEPEPAAAV